MEYTRYFSSDVIEALFTPADVVAFEVVWSKLTTWVCSKIAGMVVPLERANKSVETPSALALARVVVNINRITVERFIHSRLSMRQKLFTSEIRRCSR